MYHYSRFRWTTVGSDGKPVLKPSRKVLESFRRVEQINKEPTPPTNIGGP